MYRGYVKLWRKLKDKDIWLKEKFTRGQAWVDLIILANHRPGHIRKRGIRIDLERGDVGWSERELAKRWRWSRNKVRRFINELCLENDQKMAQQTIPQNKNITSCYSIVNYNQYQGNDTANDTTKEPQRSHKRYQNNNVKNVKNDKEYIILGEFKNVKLTKEELAKLKTSFKFDYNERIENLSHYVESTGKKYKSHYATILNWGRKDRKSVGSTYTKQPECSKCGQVASSIKRNKECPFCGELA